MTRIALSIKEAAEATSLNKYELIEAIRDETCPAFTEEGRLYIYRDDLATWVSELDNRPRTA